MANDSKGLIGTIARDPAALRFNRGIEREALRVEPDGNLSQTPHPDFLGSKLAHPSITTDFSEAQLELITPVSDSIDETLDTLLEVHRFVASGLEDEILWARRCHACYRRTRESRWLDTATPTSRSSKPRIATDSVIATVGQCKPSARSTTISPCPNHSGEPWRKPRVEPLSTEYRSRRYFDLMRNFRRFAWLPVYLFGASPAVCNSFVQGRTHELDAFDEGSLYAPGATSLRSGNLGYQSDTQGGLLGICYNGLDYYVTALATAICTPFPEYEQIGLVRDGEHLQVNTSILQSEAEFYTNIRAKCVPEPGTNFLSALRHQGVEYVEVRLLDVNPYLPLGIDAEQIRFLDMLLTHALLSDSPEHDELLCRTVNDNMQAVVWRGRDPSLALDDNGTARSVPEWGHEILRALEPIAEALDAAEGTSEHAAEPHRATVPPR
ncbi:MAG: glutamate--cysteine ligase [Gammaproteobacteria bacterium]|nr:glutamate--cysteine ligase [Gammaproteobacteria bacterium]